jgi:hypothetical protein
MLVFWFFIEKMKEQLSSLFLLVILMFSEIYFYYYFSWDYIIREFLINNNLNRKINYLINTHQRNLDHFYKCLIFLRWRYYFISPYSWFTGFLGALSVVWCWINFFSYFILISFNRSYFSFYFKINNFFYSSILFCCS